MEKIRHVYGNVMKLAIPLTIRIRTISDGRETETEIDFYPNMNYPTKVILVGVGFIRYEYDALIEGNVALIKTGTDVRVGTYHIEVLAHDENSEPVRFKERNVIEIVDAGVRAVSSGYGAGGRSADFVADFRSKKTRIDVVSFARIIDHFRIGFL